MAFANVSTTGQRQREPTHASPPSSWSNQFSSSIWKGEKHWVTESSAGWEGKGHENSLGTPLISPLLSCSFILPVTILPLRVVRMCSSVFVICNYFWQNGAGGRASAFVFQLTIGNRTRSTPPATSHSTNLRYLQGKPTWRLIKIVSLITIAKSFAWFCRSLVSIIITLRHCWMGESTRSIALWALSI